MNPDLPPPNRAIGWYRFTLWSLPWSIAVSTSLLLDWVGGPIRMEKPWVAAVWLILNLAATVGIGVFDDRLRIAQRGGSERVKPGNVARFLFLQLFIIPWFAMAILFSVCLVVGAVS